MNWGEIVSALTWRDALDFGLLYFVLYGALRLLRGTRAIPVLLAVGCFAAASFVAAALDLVAVAAMLKYFLEYIIIVLIVVFHQELRRILTRVGQRLLPTARQEAKQSAVSSLAHAAERLAKARVGALFILEGEMDVMSVCSSGTPVDAGLDPETLVALAVPHPANTAHDGAVVIRDFRIERVGVICPLSERGLDPRFGTRHRGAVGVSEEIDGLVIVLSEERGEIRVVQGGQISEALAPKELEIVIYHWIDRPPPEATGAEPRLDVSEALSAERSMSAPVVSPVPPAGNAGEASSTTGSGAP